MKKLIFILTFIIGITFTSFAQATQNPDQGKQAKLIKFYPNPATSAINFDFLRGYDRSYTLMIFNFMGKQVYDLKNILPRMNITLEDFYRGIYIFQLRDKNGTIVETGKFQVVK